MRLELFGPLQMPTKFMGHREKKKCNFNSADDGITFILLAVPAFLSLVYTVSRVLAVN